MSRSWMGALLATAATVSLISGPAVAEEHRGWWPGWGWNMERMMSGDRGPGMMGWWRSNGMLDRMDGRLAYMKTELKIAPEQTAAWDSFAAVMRTSAEAHNDVMRSMAEQFDDGEILDKPLPERLAWQISHMETQLEQMRPVKVAADDLYAVLTDQQKSVADDIVSPMMGMGMGMANRHGWPMMHW